MNKKLSKISLFGLAVGILAVSIWLIRKLDEEPLKSQIELYVEQLGPWAPVGIFVLRLVSVVIPIIPGVPQALLAGKILDYPTALGTIVVSDLCSCSIAFYLARRFGRNLVEKLVGKKFMGRVDELSSKHLEKNFFLLAGALMTGAFDFVSYSVGLTTTKWKMFLPGLLIASLVRGGPIVAIGATLFDKGTGYLYAGLSILGAFCVAILAGWLQQRGSTSTNKK